MKRKEKRNRNVQNEFLVKLNNCINAYDNADELLKELNDYCDTIPDQQSSIDLERSDYLHLLEEYEMTDASRIYIAKCLEDVANRRRNLNNVAILNGVWQKDKGKIINSANRVFLKQHISECLQHLDENYKYRVLDDDKIDEILNARMPKKHDSTDEKPIKYGSKKGSGRTKGAKNLGEDIRKAIAMEANNGTPVRKLAIKYNTTRSNVYHILKKYR